MPGQILSRLVYQRNEELAISMAPEDIVVNKATDSGGKWPRRKALETVIDELNMDRSDMGWLAKTSCSMWV